MASGKAAPSACKTVHPDPNASHRLDIANFVLLQAFSPMDTSTNQAQPGHPHQPLQPQSLGPHPHLEPGRPLHDKENSACNALERLSVLAVKAEPAEVSSGDGPGGALFFRTGLLPAGAGGGGEPAEECSGAMTQVSCHRSNPPC